MRESVSFSLSMLSASACGLLLLFVSGCTDLKRLAAVPVDMTEQATVLGIQDARYFPDTQAPAMVDEAIRALGRERDGQRMSADRRVRLPPAAFLAISGGSDNGAFAAGLLNGWQQTGTMPEFKLVTGISTGSLVAPFAFLGGEYIQKIGMLYTSIGPKDIYTSRGLVNAIFNESLADTTPLYQLIARHVDARLMAAIAAEYRKGRLLLIGSTNIDVQRPVIWNVGAIAATGRPEALELFRKILLASAAVPGVFPPVMIDVEAGGQSHQEMHVDGGAVAQTFLYPPQIGSLIDLRKGQYARQRHAYVIRCGRLDPDWASVERSLISITGRAISTMIHYSGYNDVLRIYNTTQQDGVDYNLAYIERDFTKEHTENFDPVYMRALYDYGFKKAAMGYRWKKMPPILDIPRDQPARLSQLIVRHALPQAR